MEQQSYISGLQEIIVMKKQPDVELVKRDKKYIIWNKNRKFFKVKCGAYFQRINSIKKYNTIMKKNYSLIKIIPVICLLITLIINNYFRESHLNTLIYILLIFSSISIFIQGKKNMLNKKSVRMLFIALLISIVIFIFQFQSWWIESLVWQWFGSLHLNINE